MVRRWSALAAGAGALLLVAACANPDAAGNDSAKPAPGHDGPKRIAFFGFAKANSYAQATFAGVEEYAEAHNASAQFFDPDFDAQTQVRQIQDAITSKRFDVFVIQANDGAAVQPAARAALNAGIAVVAAFTPMGPRFDTAKPQVPGSISVVDLPVDNGRQLGELGIDACRSKKAQPCKVAYLEGFKSLPLDNARTKAVVQALKKGGSGVKLVAKLEGGYTQESGRKAMQDVLQAAPDVDVVIGSSQAIGGAEKVAGGKDIAYVGNGGSRQAVQAVQQGRWYALYSAPPKSTGAKAAELGLKQALGKKVEATNVITDLIPGGKGTKDSLKGVTGEYDDE